MTIDLERNVVQQTVSRTWKKGSAFLIDDTTACRPFSQALSLSMSWDEEFTQRAIFEYKKFMVLCAVFPKANLVPSVHVDTVWHMHLLYTRSYQQFCKDALGCAFLHHEPSTGEPSEGQFHESSYSKTLELYESFFGSPPFEIWGGRVRAN